MSTPDAKQRSSLEFLENGRLLGVQTPGLGVILALQTLR